MNKPELTKPTGESFGYAHLAYQVENNEAVNFLHKRLIDDGYKHVNGPRITGDGYYEVGSLVPNSCYLQQLLPDLPFSFPC